MPLLNAHHSHHWYFPRIAVDQSRNMRLLFGIRLVRELINKFSLFFLPVFLFQLGYTAQIFAKYGLSDFQSGIVLLATFQILERLASLFFSFPAGDFIRRYGYSASLMLSQLLYGILLFCLRLALLDQRWLILGAVSGGVSALLMWGSFNTLFSKNAQKARMGKDLGMVQALLNLIWMVSPALSGLIIFLTGYEFLFTAGLILVGMAILFAAFIDIPRERDAISFKELMFWISDRRFVKLGASIAGKSVYDLAIFVWPLYVFLLLGNTERVGLVYGISFLLAIVMSLFVGEKLDHDERRRPFTISGGLLSVLWIIRSQVLDFWSITLVDTFDRITGNFHWLFFDRVLLNRGKGREAFSYFMYREIIISCTVILFWMLFAALFVLWRLEWRGLFVVAAAGTLMSLLINKKHDED